MNVLQEIAKTQTIRPVRKENGAVAITMNPDRSMEVEQANGNKFTLKAEDKTMQAFVIWTMVNKDAVDTK